MRKLTTRIMNIGKGSEGIVIPRTIRDMLETKKGDTFQIFLDNHKGEESIIMRKLDNDGK